jgi:LysR family transcriptional regulator of beta-lactamase
VRRRLPSLNGLRAFEAAGRHCSFTAAAEELHVTQAAVSRLVRVLEERLGFALFHRQANALHLTPRGQALLTGLTEAFDSIAQLTERVEAMSSGPVLTVGVGPALAVTWLIPRLIRFYRNQPDVEIRLATGGTTLSVRDDWSCAIRRDHSCPAGYLAEKLFPSTVLPVCTPKMAANFSSPDDLRGAALIRVSTMPDDWQWWFKSARLRFPVRQAGDLTFESSGMAIQAALDGAGVAVAQLPYVSDALSSGRLVVPFKIAARKPESWFLEYRSPQHENRAFMLFCGWLCEEAQKQRQVDQSFP